MERTASGGLPSGDSRQVGRWPLPPLRPKRAAYGVAGLRSSDDESLDSSLRKCLLLLSGPTRQCPVPLRMVAVPSAQRHEPNGAEFDVHCVFPLADLNKNATFRLTRT